MANEYNTNVGILMPDRNIAEQKFEEGMPDFLSGNYDRSIAQYATAIGLIIAEMK